MHKKQRRFIVVCFFSIPQILGATFQNLALQDGIKKIRDSVSELPTPRWMQHLLQFHFWLKKWPNCLLITNWIGDICMRIFAYKNGCLACIHTNVYWCIHWFGWPLSIESLLSVFGVASVFAKRPLKVIGDNRLVGWANFLFARRYFWRFIGAEFATKWRIMFFGVYVVEGVVLLKKLQ